MVASNSVLLPKVFPKDLVLLGQLLRNPLVPNTDTFRGGCAMVREDDISTLDRIAPYETTVSVDTRGRFVIGLTKLLGVTLGGCEANGFSIKAKSLEYSTLKDAIGVFRRISASEEAKKWIDAMVRFKTPCYLVIGIQTLCEADFKRVALRGGAASLYATTPSEITQILPIHFGGEGSAHNFGSSVGTVSGVFGIEVQRLDPRIGSGEVRLKSVSWKWSYQKHKGFQQSKRPQQEEEKHVDIILEDVTVDELRRVYAEEDEDENN